MPADSGFSTAGTSGQDYELTAVNRKIQVFDSGSQDWLALCVTDTISKGYIFYFDHSQYTINSTRAAVKRSRRR